MRHGRIELDLSTHEFLTDPEFDPKDTKGIKAGNHLIRPGYADPKQTAHGAHPNGQPMRIARDRFSGKYFVQLFEHLPTQPENAHHERQLRDADRYKPVHVAGHGYWVPLEEYLPSHPHNQIFGARPPRKPEPARAPAA